jgi:acetylornithine/N-succinyldiaminopimelate aminotransferase
MLGIAVKDKRNQLLKLLQDQKMLVIPAGENVVRLLPSFLITHEEINLVAKAFQTAFDALN